MSCADISFIFNNLPIRVNAKFILQLTLNRASLLYEPSAQKVTIFDSALLKLFSLLNAPALIFFNKPRRQLAHVAVRVSFNRPLRAHTSFKLANSKNYFADCTIHFGANFLINVYNLYRFRTLS